MKHQSGYGYLFKNVGLLTLSTLTTKLLAFFLVPLYTNVLTTSEYGTYDLLNTTIGILLPILTLNIQESVLRFALDKKVRQEAIVTVSLKYLLIGNVLTGAGLLLNRFCGFSSILSHYSVIIFLMFLTQSVSGILTFYATGIDKVTYLSISSIIASVFTIGCNILFLVVFKWGLMGYFTANVIGLFAQCIYLLFCSNYVSSIKIRKFREEEKMMISYSKPLIANSVAWWINNVSDRYVIVIFCGLAENGVYSVAGKIPAILNIFQNIFNQAWTLSAVKDFDRDDKNGFFTNTYRAYNCLMTIICSGIILFDKVLAHFLYAKDFYVAWKYVPWLTIAILFGALSGYIGGLFSAVKDSKIFATSTIIGALTNVVLNFVFTPRYGALGASVATAICYVVVFSLRFLQSKKYIKLKINIFRDILTYILLCLQSIFLMMNGIKMYMFVGSIFVIICLLYAKDISIVFEKVIRRKC